MKEGKLMEISREKLIAADFSTESVAIRKANDARDVVATSA